MSNPKVFTIIKYVMLSTAFMFLFVRSEMQHVDDQRHAAQFAMQNLEVQIQNAATQLNALPEHFDEIGLSKENEGGFLMLVRDAEEKLDKAKTAFKEIKGTESELIQWAPTFYGKLFYFALGHKEYENIQMTADGSLYNVNQCLDYIGTCHKYITNQRQSMISKPR